MSANAWSAIIALAALALALIQMYLRSEDKKKTSSKEDEIEQRTLAAQQRAELAVREANAARAEAADALNRAADAATRAADAQQEIAEILGSDRSGIEADLKIRRSHYDDDAYFIENVGTRSYQDVSVLPPKSGGISGPLPSHEDFLPPRGKTEAWTMTKDQQWIEVKIGDQPPVRLPVPSQRK